MFHSVMIRINHVYDICRKWNNKYQFTIDPIMFCMQEKKKLNARLLFDIQILLLKTQIGSHNILMT